MKFLHKKNWGEINQTEDLMSQVSTSYDSHLFVNILYVNMYILFHCKLANSSVYVL